MAVEIDIVYQGDLHCEARHGPSGQAFTTDAPTDNGGKGEAFSPTDLLATAFGACAMTVMGIVAARTGLDLSGTRVHVVKEMSAVPVRRVGGLKVTVTFPEGRVVEAADRRRLEAAVKLCPVGQSLHPDVSVDVRFVHEGDRPA